MGYEEVLKTLEQQIKNCKNKQEYLKKQRELALKTKDIATLIGINIASTAVQIRKMIKLDQIKVIEGLNNTPEENRGRHKLRSYVLSEEYVEEEKLLK